MGELAEELKNLIRKWVDDRGIVVWYDPEGIYEPIFQELDGEGLEKFQYQDSLFRLRRETDPLLERETRPRAVVYLPMERSRAGYAMVELEKAGTVIYPGAQTGHNTRLEVLAKAVLKRYLPEDKAEEIRRQISEKKLTLEEIESVIENARHVVPEVLRLIFGTDDPMEISLAFLSDGSFSEKVGKRAAVTELSTLLGTQFGLQFKQTNSVEDLRRELRRAVLIGELIDSLEGEAPESLVRYQPPEQRSLKGLYLQVPKRWRQRRDLLEAYEESADLTEAEFRLGSMDIKGLTPRSADTFRFAAEAILRTAEERIEEEDSSSALDVLERSSKAFWFGTDPGLAFKHDFLSQVAKLILKSQEIYKELQKAELEAQEMVERYASGDSPWFRLDQLQRKVEQDYEHYEARDAEEADRLERIMARARQSFGQSASTMADRFQEALKKSGFSCGRVMRQREIFKKVVEPLLEEGKVAYVCVDALRYEMGEQLADELRRKAEVDLSPAVATLPTVTGVGMASLLPGAEGAISLSVGAGNVLGLNLEGKKVITREERISILRERVKGETVTAVVDELQKRTHKLKNALENAAFAYVTSQEIDSLCESGNDSMARDVMEQVLARLRRAIGNLASYGFANIVITADHGYLFGEEVESGMKVDPPGGKTLVLKQRVWVGEGGSSSESFRRVRGKDLGLEDGVEIAFPRATACFKVKGGGRSYFHGGISLQEMVIPVLVLRAGEQLATRKGRKKPAINIHLDRKKVGRYFRVKVEWPGQGSLLEEEMRLKAVLRIEGKEKGKAIAADKGFDAASEEFTIVSGQENVVTVIVDEDVSGQHTGSLHLIDADTGAEVAVLEDIFIDITF